MTISEKRKRKIVVDDAEYLWWVAEDASAYDPAPQGRAGPGYGCALKIVSVDGEKFWRLYLPLLVRTREGSRQVHEFGSGLIASIIQQHQAGADLGWDELNITRPALDV